MSAHLSLSRPILALLACAGLACLAAPAKAQIVQFLGVPTADEVLQVLTGKAVEPVQGLRSAPPVQTTRIIRDTPDLPADPGAIVGTEPGRQEPPSGRLPRPVRRVARLRPPAALTFADNFALGSAVLPPRTVALLDNTAEALKRDTAIQILISGHTDSSGNPDSNVRLSLRRAQAARQRLMEHGAIDGGRIMVLGAGATQPMPGTSSAAPDNRRIQVVRIAGAP